MVIINLYILLYYLHLFFNINIYTRILYLPVKEFYPFKYVVIENAIEQ